MGLEGPGAFRIRAGSFVGRAILVRYPEQFHECSGSGKGPGDKSESAGHERELSAATRRWPIGLGWSSFCPERAKRLNPGFQPHRRLSKASAGRFVPEDSMIVARHEVPGVMWKITRPSGTIERYFACAIFDYSVCGI